MDGGIALPVKRLVNPKELEVAPLTFVFHALRYKVPSSVYTSYCLALWIRTRLALRSVVLCSEVKSVGGGPKEQKRLPLMTISASQSMVY